MQQQQNKHNFNYNRNNNDDSALALQHTLRASSCNGHEALAQLDNLLRIALCKICNVSLSDD